MMLCIPGIWYDPDLAPSQIIAQMFLPGSLRTYLRKMKRKMQNVLQRHWCSHPTCEGQRKVWLVCSTNICAHRRPNGSVKDGVLVHVEFPEGVKMVLEPRLRLWYWKMFHNHICNLWPNKWLQRRWKLQFCLFLFGESCILKREESSTTNMTMCSAK